MRNRTGFADTLKRELKQAARSLARTPSFTAMTVLTLTIALGAAAAIFTILDAVVLRPLPYPHGERLVALFSPVPGIKASPVWGLGRHELAYFKRTSRTLEDLGLYQNEALTVLGDDGHDAERVMTASVSASLFSTLGITPEAGRLIAGSDNANSDLTRALTVGVLSHGFWARRFGADPSIIGKTIDVQGSPLTVIGIVPARAQLPDLSVDIWTPLYIDPNAAHNNHTYHGIGRLRPGFTVSDAQRELTTLTARFGEVFPSVYTPRMLRATGFTTRVTSLRDEVVGTLVTKAIWILFGAVGVVLLIAAANVANLFLVRIEGRRLEVAVREALGARRADLAWHFLAESLTLTLLSSLGAIAVGWGGLRLLLALAPSDLPRLDEIRLGWPSVGFTIGCAIVAGMVLGLVPSGGAHADLAMLRDGTRGATGSRRRLASRNVLVVSQMALALVLLTAAGLLVRSLRNLRNVDPGFVATGVMTMALELPNAEYRHSYVRASNFYEQLASQIHALPGVTAVGFGGELPLQLGDWCTGAVVDVPGASGERGDCVQMMQVTPGYFEALRIPVHGEAPTWSETNQRGAGAVVSSAFANRFWPRENAIGRGVRCCNATPPFYRITGITGPVRTHGLDRPAGQVVYFPVIPFDSNTGIEGSAAYMRLVVRAAGASPATLVPSIRRIIHDADPQIPITDVMSMEEILAKSLARRSFTMLLIATAAALALVLSAVGIYGVVSYVVAQRRGEIGIRMALGARAGAVRAMVVRQSLAVASTGVAIGLVASVATTRLLSALLYGVSPTDPAILAAATVVLVLISVAASYAPALRASRVDPAESLRT